MLGLPWRCVPDLVCAPCVKLPFHECRRSAGQHFQDPGDTHTKAFAFKVTQGLTLHGQAMLVGFSSERPSMTHICLVWVRQQHIAAATCDMVVRAPRQVQPGLPSRG